MKWLFKFFLFICILFTAGSSHYPLSFPGHKLAYHVNISLQQYHLNDTKFTPALPVRDLRVFQIIEDEEDNISSRVKKSTQYASTLFVFLSTGALIFIFQSLVKNRFDNRLIAFNSHHRYIQLRTIRI